jgi:hypothetical protein
VYSGPGCNRPVRLETVHAPARNGGAQNGKQGVRAQRHIEGLRRRACSQRQAGVLTHGRAGGTKGSEQNGRIGRGRGHFSEAF